MKVKCPVAGCDYTVRGANDGFKHWQKYDEFHKQLHRNFLSYFFPDLANSDWSDEVKFRFAYKKWHEDEKKTRVQMSKKKDGNVDSNVTMKDGKVIYNGLEYTPEQFSNVMKGIKYMPVDVKK